MRFDIIGDIHGHTDELCELLEKLGYQKRNRCYKHGETDRKAIFVGDFIDRGPNIRETLSIVKPMDDNDAAYAVLGNHEYNALCFHTLIFPSLLARSYQLEPASSPDRADLLPRLQRGERRLSCRLSSGRRKNIKSDRFVWV